MVCRFVKVSRVCRTYEHRELSFWNEVVNKIGCRVTLKKLRGSKRNAKRSQRQVQMSFDGRIVVFLKSMFPNFVFISDEVLDIEFDFYKALKNDSEISYSRSFICERVQWIELEKTVFLYFIKAMFRWLSSFSLARRIYYY